MLHNGELTSIQPCAATLPRVRGGRARGHCNYCRPRTRVHTIQHALPSSMICKVEAERWKTEEAYRPIIKPKKSGFNQVSRIGNEFLRPINDFGARRILM